MHIHNLFNQLNNQNTQSCLTTHISHKNVNDYHWFSFTALNSSFIASQNQRII